MKIYPRHTINIPIRKALRLVTSCFVQGSFSAGGDIESFERQFAEIFGVKHALTVSSARQGFYVMLQAMGILEGDEIILPAYTFHIMPAVIRACGFVPVFVDVCPDTKNIDARLIEKHITSKTKAILATHILGQPCDLHEILIVAKRHGLKVIEDCAHACGAQYHGQSVGSIGDAGLFSFGTGKNMPCFGGGMITTSDDSLAQKMRILRDESSCSPFTKLSKKIIFTLMTAVFTKPHIFPFTMYPLIRFFRFFGFALFDRILEEKNVIPNRDDLGRNAKMSNVQAAIGLYQLQRLKGINEKLAQNAQQFTECLQFVNGISLQKPLPGTLATYLYYQLGVDNVKVVRRKLLSKGIDTKKDDMSFPDKGIYNVSPKEYPVASRISQKALDIPNNIFLDSDDIVYIAKTINQIVNAKNSR